MSKKNCQPGALVAQGKHGGLLLWIEGTMGIVLGFGETQWKRFKLHRLTVISPPPPPKPQR